MTEVVSPRKRASRYTRPKNLEAMRLTHRDKLVVKAVNDFRLMRQDQIQRLMFPSRNTAQVRLRKLWEHGFLKRQFMPVIGGIQTSPILYEIDKRGVALLQNEFGYDEAALRYSRRKNLGTQFLDHTLGLTEIRLAFELSCRKNDLELTNWWDEKAMKSDYDKVQVGRRMVAVLPDAYFVIRIPEGSVHFFLEYDRGFANLKSIKKKMAAYMAYYRSGKCKRRYGTNRVRVLTVNEGGRTGVSYKRLANLKKVTEEVGGGRRFLFSGLTDFVGGDVLVAVIWLVAGGREVVSLL